MRAWIETVVNPAASPVVLRSHAVCVRGLKQFDERTVEAGFEVARRVRAWIETDQLQTIIVDSLSHAVCVRGLKQAQGMISMMT